MSIFLFNTFKHAGVTIQRGVDEIDARFKVVIITNLEQKQKSA